MTTMEQIERQAKRYADAHEALTGIVGELNSGIESVKRSHMKALRKAVAGAAEEHDKLKSLIESARGAFEKPRSVVFHGVRCGMQKGKGKLQYKKPEKVIELIRKHFPEQAAVLIQTSEEPSKEALGNLSVADLKKIGVELVGAGDFVLIRPADSAVDKMVDALLKDAVEEVQ